ncbi:aldehyde dehydrogenase family protein, partial [Bacillus pseudomycoides]|uniref:aldehyde dehydrogenase family protein n=1 Tax=Bacillus pseudomycoides TaxID=64104 RepID=UPI00283B0DD8
GVPNMVMCAVPIVGNEIAASNKVYMISFTGGIKTVKHIMRTAAVKLKLISLELVVKFQNIIFSDADFETAVDYAL